MANGSFIKHQSDIYTVGQKDTSPPSGTRKEKSQGVAPKVGQQLNREKRKPGGRAQAQRKADPGTLPAARTLLAGGITITVKGEFSLSYTLGP